MGGRESRTAGFIGQNLEVERLWSPKSHRESSGSQTASVPLLYEPLERGNKMVAQEAYDVHATRKLLEASSTVHTSDSSFCLNDNDFGFIIAVNPYESPPSKITDRLFDRDVQTTRILFPIVPDVFDNQFRDHNQSVKRNQWY